MAQVGINWEGLAAAGLGVFLGLMLGGTLARARGMVVGRGEHMGIPWLAWRSGPDTVTLEFQWPSNGDTERSWLVAGEDTYDTAAQRHIEGSLA